MCETQGLDPQYHKKKTKKQRNREDKISKLITCPQVDTAKGRGVSDILVLYSYPYSNSRKTTQLLWTPHLSICHSTSCKIAHGHQDWIWINTTEGDLWFCSPPLHMEHQCLKRESKLHALHHDCNSQDQNCFQVTQPVSVVPLDKLPTSDKSFHSHYGSHHRRCTSDTLLSIPHLSELQNCKTYRESGSLVFWFGAYCIKTH